MKLESLRLLIEKFGDKYSEMLGINISSAREEEIFKWFLASILFGAPIRESSAIKTYKCFEKYNVLTPRRILETGWDGLVKILDEGGYTRYDFKTADKLLEVMQNLMEKYDGSLTNLQNKASDSRDLEEKIIELGKGIGNVTVNIFLRELRGIWQKADPKPTALTIFAATKLGILKEDTQQKALEYLKEFWSKNIIAEKSFINFETALLKLGKDFCKKRKCANCMFRGDCLKPEAP